MGTRHVVMVVSKGKTKVAQYGQWDGYIGGVGVGVLDFLLGEKFNNFIQKVDKCKFISDDEIDKKDINLYPQFHRNTSSKVLELIADSNNEVELHDSEDFIASSLFCEWAYIIDLDKQTFEIYEGFNKRKLRKTERFAFLQETEHFIEELKKEKERGEKHFYYPCKHLATYNLSKLPTIEKFLEIADNSVDEKGEYIKSKFKQNIKTFEKSLSSKKRIIKNVDV